MAKKKEFWPWSAKSYTPAEVKELLEAIKKFNAGAIDEYLTKHVDKAYNEWIAKHGE